MPILYVSLNAKETSLNAKGNVFECDFPLYCIKSYLKALKACMRKSSADNSICSWQKS